MFRAALRDEGHTSAEEPAAGDPAAGATARDVELARALERAGLTPAGGPTAKGVAPLAGASRSKAGIAASIAGMINTGLADAGARTICGSRCVDQTA
jgi:FAD/FMN-containing dehydrogenase